MNRRGGGGRLTLFGRISLAALAVGCLGAAYASRGLWQNSDPAQASPLPAVSAAPPLIRIDRAWIEDPPRSRSRFALARLSAHQNDASDTSDSTDSREASTRSRDASDSRDGLSPARLVEWLEPTGLGSFHRRGDVASTTPSVSSAGGAMRIEYSLDEKLTENIFEILRRGKVERGQAIVLDPRSGRLLAYVSTNPTAFPPDAAYPAASIIKILTAATLLEEAPKEADAGCLYNGNKYRINRRRLVRPKRGNEATLEGALASSNNQCFSQWAVNVIGEEKLRATLTEFGWLAPAAPGHDAGRVEAVESDLDLGRLGSGLSGVRVNPLHVASLASILTDGHWVEPWWIDRVVDAYGRSLELPARAPRRQVLSAEVATRLRSMLVATTTKGTAKRAFRTRRGRQLLSAIDVAGKTGNLTGRDPDGRYEWFLGLAPANDPTIAVVILQLQSNLWWSRSSELGAKVLHSVFCDAKRCQAQLADRWTANPVDGGGRMNVSRPPQFTRELSSL